MEYTNVKVTTALQTGQSIIPFPVKSANTTLDFQHATDMITCAWRPL
jgi:hypothetical protein